MSCHSGRGVVGNRSAAQASATTAAPPSTSHERRIGYLAVSTPMKGATAMFATTMHVRRRLASAFDNSWAVVK